MTHMIDRACIGHCFSYGNYEALLGCVPRPEHRAKRIRDRDYLDSWDMRNGKYVVQERDPPLWQVFKDDDEFYGS